MGGGSEVELAAQYCERKADAFAARRGPDFEEARAVARQLRIVADDLRAGFHREAHDGQG